MKLLLKIKNGTPPMRKVGWLSFPPRGDKQPKHTDQLKNVLSDCWFSTLKESVRVLMITPSALGASQSRAPPPALVSLRPPLLPRLLCVRSQIRLVSSERARCSTRSCRCSCRPPWRTRSATCWSKSSTVSSTSWTTWSGHTCTRWAQGSGGCLFQGVVMCAE